MRLRIALPLFVLFGLQLPSVAPELTLPCPVSSMAVAADGSGIWFVCSANSKAQHPRNEREAYWLPTATKTPVKIEEGSPNLAILPAPSGSRALIVGTPRSGQWQASLYDKQQPIKELPIDASFVLWGADSHKIYFYGGSTVQADVWDILGIYDLNSGAISKIILHEPTEILRVCQANGNVYSVTPPYPHFDGSTIEYTPTIQFVRKVQGWVGALFSADCTYVASEYSYHGPLPWSIYEVKTGRKMYHFSALDQADEDDVYVPVEWNPRHDSVLLREYFPKHDGPR